MPRYESSKNGSSKFWEIKVCGKSFITTYGKIGSNGKSTTRIFESSAAAKNAADKLTAEKVKKGYAQSKAKPAKKMAGTKSNAKSKVAKAPVKGKAKAPVKGKAKTPVKGKAKTPVKGKAKAPVKGKAKTPVKGKAKANRTETKAAPPKLPLGTRYFEFTDGSSSKFWEVSVAGAVLSTRHGKIGTEGKASSKTLALPAAANKERDRLCAQKAKKGYLERGWSAGQPSSGVLNARNPTLEAAILKDPTDEAAFAVLADWLHEQGDPRGELIALQLGGKDKKAKALIAKNEGYFLGPLAEHKLVYDEGGNNSVSSLRTKSEEKAWQKTQREAFLWRNGYIHRIRLSHDEQSVPFSGKMVDILEAALRHPSAIFAVEFAFQYDGDPWTLEPDLQALIDLLGKMAPATTRKITFGDNVDQISWHRTGELKSLWKGVPNLKVLEIETGHFDVGKMVAPALERAIFITGGLTKQCAKNIAKAKMPSIKHLEIYYGDPDYGGHCTVKEVHPLLMRNDLENLETLGLKNSMFADDLVGVLPGAPILDGIKTLDLSLGAMTDKGAKVLAASKKAFSHLECLDLSRNFLTEDGIKAVMGICKTVITSGQREPWDWDETPQYYVSVAE